MIHDTNKFHMWNREIVLETYIWVQIKKWPHNKSRSVIIDVELSKVYK